MVGWGSPRIGDKMLSQLEGREWGKRRENEKGVGGIKDALLLHVC